MAIDARRPRADGAPGATRRTRPTASRPSARIARTCPACRSRRTCRSPLTRRRWPRADLIIVAVPSAHVRETVERLADRIPAERGPAVARQGPRARHAPADERGDRRGGGHRDQPASRRSADRTSRVRSPAGCPRRPSSARSTRPRARRIQARLGSRSFRVYVNADIVGVELCGALKNIIAIAAGAADGLGFGDNGKAGLMTRGLAEMIRLGLAAGANPLTFAGLAGIGDVIATCGSGLSRNHRLGVELANGPPLGGDREQPARRRGGRLHGGRGARAGRAARASSCRSRGRSRRRCSKARASSAASSTCSRASRRTSWRTCRPGSICASERSRLSVHRTPGAPSPSRCRVGASRPSATIGHRSGRGAAW